MKVRSFIYFVLALCSTAWATDGYFATGVGTENKGLSGSGIAFLNGTGTAALNPAAISFSLNSGWSFEVAVAFFNPIREYSIAGQPSPIQDPRSAPLGLPLGTVESDNSIFIIPTIAVTYKMDDENTFGLNIYGNGGMNTEYDTKTYFSPTLDGFFTQNGFTSPLAGVTAPTGVNLEQLFVSATYSRKLGDKHALGLSPIFAYQSFEATGLQAFRDFGMAGANGEFVTNNDDATATGFGFRVGYQGELFDNFRVGAAYQSEIDMSEFDEYKGLFAEEGDFDIPANWSAGVSYSFNESFTVVADVKSIMYSDIKAIANGLDVMALTAQFPDPNGPGVIANPNFIPLGSDDGAGFGWDDIMVYKVGAIYTLDSDWTLRAGFSSGDNPISKENVLFNIIAPGVIENHISFGVTRNLGDKVINLAITHALDNSISGPNPMDPAQTIELKMNQWEFEVGFGF
jgi:long-chain fatty acid transport protein